MKSREVYVIVGSGKNLIRFPLGNIVIDRIGLALEPSLAP